jgi:hypothetical protein
MKRQYEAGLGGLIFGMSGGKGISTGKVEMDCILALTLSCINCIILTLLAKFFGILKKSGKFERNVEP